METGKVVVAATSDTRSGSAVSRTVKCLEDRKSQVERNGRTDEIRRRYASLLTNHPWVAFLTTFLMVLLAGTTGFVTKFGAKPLPDFSSPGKGFEARGTEISTRILSHNNLFKEMPGVVRLQTSSYVPTMGQASNLKSNRRECTLEVLPYLASKTIYTSINEESLFNAENLKDVCKLEEEVVRRQHMFDTDCTKGNENSTECCPSISIGYYAAVLANKTSCQNISDEDVDNLKRVIAEMHSKNRTESTGSTITKEEKIGYMIMQFLVDKKFAANPIKEKLEYTLVFSPVEAPSRKLLKDMYEMKLQGNELPKSTKVQLAAYDFEHLKVVAYDSQLIADVWYIMLAVGLILGLMWGYSGSLFISIMGFSSVIFAIILSYWFYTVVFRLVFFPFLNIMTAIFVVGIGADDIFVYVLAWGHARQKFSEAKDKVTTLAQCTEYALEHATAAMFVTSFTTATAFYAGLSSSITALQCFSIFAGTSILTNYFLMITWLPAVIIAQERFFDRITCKKSPKKSNEQIHPGTSALTSKELKSVRGARKCFPVDISDIKEKLKRWSDVIFQEWIGEIVVKLRYCWLGIFLVVALFGLLSLTYYPKLSLPTTQQMPLFIKSHTIEKFDSEIKSKLKIEDFLSTDNVHFPVKFVWGVRDVDNGYFLNPSSTGRTEWDSSFTITKEGNQMAMLKFCKDIKQAPFYDKEKNKASWCFMENLQEYLKRECSQDCCNRTLPLKEEEFRKCTKEYVENENGLPIKLNADGSVKALVLSFQSVHKYEMKFSPVEKFWKEVTKWTERELKKMPDGLKNGWAISSLYFYDLQKSIADGTIKTIAVSIGISALVLLLTTQNIIITIYAVIAITAIISVTIGSLVMAGWRLNVLESMMMSVAIGLSIDFTLHYGVAYFSCEKSRSRKERVYNSLWHVGSAVAMGTVTTFLAGLVMMPSVIHAYIQIGHFLMLIMSTSWVYSTFFFLALCAVLGPQGHVGDIIQCWKMKKSKVVPSNSYEMKDKNEMNQPNNNAN